MLDYGVGIKRATRMSRPSKLLNFKVISLTDSQLKFFNFKSFDAVDGVKLA